MSFLLDLVGADWIFMLATRSARIRFNGEDAAQLTAATQELLHDPAPVWPGGVTRAEVDRIDGGLQVSWYRWRRRTPSWDAYGAQIRSMAGRYPGLTVTVERVGHPVALVDETYRP